VRFFFLPLLYLNVDLRLFQRDRRKLDEDLKFSVNVQNKCTVPIEWRSKKTMDRPVFALFNRTVSSWLPITIKTNPCFT